MASMNKVFLIGNLTRDPEVKFVASGKAVADLRLAVTRRFRASDGEYRQDACFVDVMVWDRQAENCGKYLRKGAPVFVEGFLKFDEWKKDGETRSRLSVIADRVQFLDRPPKRGDEFSDTPDAANRTAPERKEPARSGHEAEQAPAADAQGPDSGGSDYLPF
ncbi:MAG: single-stranded DNA-binding protein [Lentisphaerae bacterium]|nr:single-stranded DNA-binding protein [Lentisphaerota bacterium]